VTRTFLDAGVLIAAIRGTPEIADRAMELLNDPERLFVSSYIQRFRPARSPPESRILPAHGGGLILPGVFRVGHRDGPGVSSLGRASL
jgi:hypothetical protein